MVLYWLCQVFGCILCFFLVSWVTQFNEGYCIWSTAYWVRRKLCEGHSLLIFTLSSPLWFNTIFFILKILWSSYKCKKKGGTSSALSPGIKLDGCLICAVSHHYWCTNRKQNKIFHTSHQIESLCHWLLVC